MKIPVNMYSSWKTPVTLIKFTRNSYSYLHAATCAFNNSVDDEFLLHSLKVLGNE